MLVRLGSYYLFQSSRESSAHQLTGALLKKLQVINAGRAIFLLGLISV